MALERDWVMIATKELDMHQTKGARTMKKNIRTILFEPQVANANLAKREQWLVVTILLLVAVAAMAI